jgi:hypothetical protein
MAWWGKRGASKEIVDVDVEVERWADRIPALNTYASVVAVIILDLLLIGLVGDMPLGQISILITRVLVLLLALHVSRVHARWDALAVLLAVGAIVIGTFAVVGGGQAGASVGAIVGIVLILIPPIAIGRRLLVIIKERGVVLEVVFGALAIYLLLGLAYATMYTAVQVISNQPFFVQEPHPIAIDYVYFSFVTLTTIGYGDFTAAGSFGRMLAVSEGLFGQLYLVTVVATIVSRLQPGQGGGLMARRGRRSGKGEPATPQSDASGHEAATESDTTTG